MLQPKFDPDKRVRIIRVSENPELAEYLLCVNASGATHMEPKGEIYVKIDDGGNATNGTWFEEFAHALQFLRYGNVPLSVDNKERLDREYEVAKCLLEKREQLRLSEDDIEHSLKIVEDYGG